MQTYSFNTLSTQIQIHTKMARGDECTKHVTATKNIDLMAAVKKPYVPECKVQTKKVDEKKAYGSWGPVYQNKNHFTNMHFC